MTDYDRDSFFDSLLSQLNDGVPSLKGKAKAKAENDHASDLLLKEIIQWRLRLKKKEKSPSDFKSQSVRDVSRK